MGWGEFCSSYQVDTCLSFYGDWGSLRSTSYVHRLKKAFRWRGMKGDVGNFVKQCPVCQQIKTDRVHHASLLQPLPITKGAWQDLIMDFIEGLPRSEGYNCILVVIDRFSKYAHFAPLKHPFIAPAMAKLVLDTVVHLHGMPRSIVSERDKIFVSSFWKELFKLLDTTLVISTAYHPQKDGQIERVNQCLEMFLRSCVHTAPAKWKYWLPLAEFWYNTAFHSSLGCTPFKVLYGYDPVIGAALVLHDIDNKSVQELLTKRRAHTELIRSHLEVAHHRMKHQANKQHTDREF
jgi:hypothetical protein